MALNIPRFDTVGIPEIPGAPKNSNCEWGWIGSVAMGNKEAVNEFIIAAKKGDLASMKLFQDISSNVVFAVARICDKSRDIVLFEKISEPIEPSLVGIWALGDMEIVIGPSIPEHIKARLEGATRLSWKEIFAAVVRAFK